MITQNTPAITNHPLSLATREKISLSKTKYTKDYLTSKAVEYINGILTAEGDKPAVPSIVGYCLAVGISRSRLYELTQSMEEVADIVEYIAMMQEELAISGGMTNRTNPIFSMFLLKSKHNYHDSPPTLNQTNNTFNVSAELLADALAIMKGQTKTPKNKVIIEENISSIEG
jgi:hypothetical protein